MSKCILSNAPFKELLESRIRGAAARPAVGAVDDLRRFRGRRVDTLCLLPNVALLGVPTIRYSGLIPISCTVFKTSEPFTVALSGILYRIRTKIRIVKLVN